MQSPKEESLAIMRKIQADPEALAEIGSEFLSSAYWELMNFGEDDETWDDVEIKSMCDFTQEPLNTFQRVYLKKSTSS